jgi:hypothetical protein
MIPDLFDIPVAAGKTDTSREAGESISLVAGTLRHEVYTAIIQSDERGMTTSELAAGLNRPYSGIQPRTSELKKHGYIFDSGERRPNAFGNNEIVWRG